ncbi:hypothetical protein RHGRI_020128 [Rhododendron griersonianum]|uniref:Uncharacterized protein n=1 Tax=Rhododendron griersonianum TaxID=479676 RepID=A0AAV6JKI4_9ERIC|nr:hypothetical protein RHGRI_020128 [Rhododendron griersonianum]
MSSSSSSSSSNLSFDHHQLPPHSSSSSSTDQLCYVHCTLCDTVLAVSVPCTSLFKTVTVRCGHCTNLLPVSMRAGFLVPSSNANQLHLTHSFFSPNPHNLLEEIANPNPNFQINQANPGDFGPPVRGGLDGISRPPVVNRPPEKRQRVPSAYNRFIKEEIQRIKAGNPDISHREAFSAAAKNWAHFPHIHFGLVPDQTVKKTSTVRQQEGDVLMKDGFFASANVGISPY